MAPGRFSPKKILNLLIGVITAFILVGALFQIHRLWRAYLARTVEKYAPQDQQHEDTLEKSTADAPPRPEPSAEAQPPPDTQPAPDASAEPASD